ncbi:MAG: YkgJ family cysteine cluster protein [Solidesulfovibrio sp.]|uniref:YkgJ family cysteine cluster protein n=1 Tax=Solidesulfovibrio sp. TaxID=2910990 RepID=UPI002B21496D|nr:YkgJ family cysteine cluster protein [Solidesulfovibrio sp.]MEA4856426.1 YkgJ family cysteine cluster protein [Solidesulfovibrio sp.]
MHAAKPVCRRCGVCCRRGGPSLGRGDLPLLASGRLGPDGLVTLRRGEYVTDNVAGGVGPLAAECVKVRPGPDGRACRFFREPDACAVHADRPLQCRLLFCEAPEAVRQSYARDRLGRRDILAPGDPLAALCAQHEAETDLTRLTALCRRALAGDGGAREEVARLIRLDAAWRQLLPERAGVPPETLPFYLGRPLPQALPACRAALAPAALYKPGPSA